MSDSHPILSRIDEGLWLRLVGIAESWIEKYRCVAPELSSESPEEMVFVALTTLHLSSIEDVAHDRVSAYLHAVVRNHFRNEVRRRRPLRDRSHRGTRSRIRTMRNLFRSLRLSARSMGLRLITYAKDRCVAVQAKLVADRFACRKIGLVEDRGLTAVVMRSPRGHRAAIAWLGRCLTYWNPGAREA